MLTCLVNCYIIMLHHNLHIQGGWLGSVLLFVRISFSRLQPFKPLNFTILPRNEAGWTGDDITLNAAIVLGKDEHVSWVKKQPDLPVIWNTAQDKEMISNALGNLTYIDGVQVSYMTLYDVNMNSMGLYTVSANDYTRHRQMAWVSVLDSLSCSKLPEYPVPTDSNMQLTCQASYGSDLPVSVSWYDPDGRSVGGIDPSSDDTTSQAQLTTDITTQLDMHLRNFTCHFRFNAPTEEMILEVISPISPDGKYIQFDDVATNAPDFEALCAVTIILDEECTSEPCLNNGTCKVLFAGYECACTQAYTGQSCEILVACMSNPCPSPAVCAADRDGYSCTCPEGEVCATTALPTTSSATVGRSSSEPETSTARVIKSSTSKVATSEADVEQSADVSGGDQGYSSNLVLAGTVCSALLLVSCSVCLVRRRLSRLNTVADRRLREELGETGTEDEQHGEDDTEDAEASQTNIQATEPNPSHDQTKPSQHNQAVQRKDFTPRSNQLPSRDSDRNPRSNKHSPNYRHIQRYKFKHLDNG